MKKIVTPILLLLTILLAVTAVLIGYKIYELREQPVAPNVPQSKPKAQILTENNTPSLSCTLFLTFSNRPSISPTVTPTSTVTRAPTVTPTPGGPTNTPLPTSTPRPPPLCGEECDVNNNKCESQAPYCVDYTGDSKGPICGRQPLASNGPQCESPPPGCDQTCDPNNNKCSSDAPYCVDYATDSKGPVCGRQPLASLGPQCEVPTPTPASIPEVGTVENTIFAIALGAVFIILGFLFL